MPPRKRKVMPLRDSSNRIRPRTPDARVERIADKPALLKSTIDIVKNDDIARPARDSALVKSASPDETNSDEYKPSPRRLPASSASDAPSPINPTRQASDCITTTPPRIPQQPPTVVETCPTPPSSSTATTPSGRVRRRPLLDERADGCSVGEEAVLPSSSSSAALRLKVATPELFKPAEQVEPIRMAAVNADVTREGSRDLPRGSRQTNPSFARRLRQTRRHSTDTPTATPPLPDLDPADLLSALLSQSLPVSEARRNSDDSARSAAASLRSERPRTDCSCSVRPESATPFARAGLSPPRFENRSRPVSPRSPPPPFRLRPQPSTTTLFSWDLAHLPAPDAPREKPYRVSWTSVLLPTRYLGGGRGSGRYGDQWGPVERKKKVPLLVARSSLPRVEGARFRPVEEEDESARSNRRWSGREWLSSSVAVVATAAGASPPAPRCSPTSGGSAVHSSASLASESRASREPEPTPSEEETRRRPLSLLRRLSRSSVASWAAGSSDSTTARKPATVSRRQSLVASLFGAKSTALKRSGEEEDFHQWVSVVLR